MTDGKFVLNDALEPVPEHDLLTWAKWMEEHNDKRRVAHDVVGESRVSTVFLGLDYAFVEGVNLPVLYETMVFSGKDDTYTNRYHSREAALKGHAEVVRRLQANEPLE